MSVAGNERIPGVPGRGLRRLWKCGHSIFTRQNRECACAESKNDRALNRDILWLAATYHEG